MDDELLIQLVHDNEILYNHERFGYKIPKQKALAWKKVARKMGATEEDCMRRWTTLRDRFSRESRRIDPLSENKVTKCSWIFYDSLLFLQPHIRPRKSYRKRRMSSYLRLSETESMSNDTSLTNPDTVPVVPSCNDFKPVIAETPVQRKRKIVEDENEYTFTEAIDTFKDLCNASKVPQEQSDEVGSFTHLIEAKICKLDKPWQNKAMKDILNYCIDLENYQEDVAADFSNLMQ